MVQLQSGLGGVPPTQTSEPQSLCIRTPVGSSLSSLSAEVSQGMDGEEGNLAQPGCRYDYGDGTTSNNNAHAL